MATHQRDFLARFRSAFDERFAVDVTWAGGQAAKETAGFRPDVLLRRARRIHPSERFELGDARCDFKSHTVIVEYDSKHVRIHNLLKYWPYLRGELSQLPTHPILLCHFSDWWSYGSYRDLWKWTLERMQTDPARRVEIRAKQFDHWREDADRGTQSLREALDWLAEALEDQSGREPN